MGALTSKPYAFNARPWELRSFESVDFFDSVGASIRLDLRGLTLMRILPYINESINEEWITDKVRFSYDGLKYQRLVAPLQRVQQKFVKLSWSQFYYQLARSILQKRTELGADLLVGQFIDSRSFLSIFSLLKALLSLRGDKSKISIIHRELEPFLTSSFSSYRSSYANFKWDALRTNKQLLLIDTNLRLESPLLNLKVRRAVLNQGLNVYSFGFQSDSLYPVYNLGSNTGSLVKFFEGRHALSRVVMNAPQSGLLLFYSHLAIRGGKGSLLASFFKSIRRLASFKLNAHYLIHSISTFGLLDMVGGSSSIVSAKAQSKKSILWCLGEDEVCFDLKNYNTVVYSGHHGDRNAAHATFLIPTLAPFEKNAHFVNILGVSRNSAFAVNGPHLALSEEFFAYTFRLYVNSLLFSRSANSNLEERSSSASVMVQFGFTNSFNEGSFTSSFFDEGKYLDYSSVINENSIDNSVSYYSDNAIVRASHVMALAQSRFKRYKTNFHS